MEALQEFFRAVLPATGWFYVAAVVPNAPAGTSNCKHKAFSTSDFMDAHKWAVNIWQHKGLSVYFTPCTWTQDYVLNQSGKNKNCRKRADLVHRVRAFWLDIDSKKQGKTVTQSLTELVAFCQSISLPLPNAIVTTGGGVHVYWTLEDELTLAQWTPLANALRTACKANGLNADHVCTADHARILRLPATRNFKYEDAPEAKITVVRPPVDFVAFAQALGPFKGPINTVLSENVNDEFSHRDVQYVPVKMAEVVNKCPLVAAIASDNGALCSEPLWKNVLHMCAHAEDGRAWAHELSRGHAGYSAENTDQKLDACDTKYPPTKCETLDGNFWGSQSPCTTCPHKGKIKSPMTLGRSADEGVIQKPDTLPDGYFLTPTGVYRTVKVEGDDTVVRVTQLPIISIQVHDVVEHHSTDTAVVPHVSIQFLDGRQRPHRGMFPLSVLSDYRSTYAALSGIRFPFTKQDYRNGFDTFMTSWVQKLREAGEVTSGRPQFGWHFKSHDAIEGFAIGRTMYLPDGTSKVMMWPDSQLNHIYTPAGSIDEWKKAVLMMQKRNRPELMVLIAGAFAAPLFTFLGESSAVVSAVSRESGVGKSSALKVAQAVWGDPKSGITSLDDTIKSVSRKMGIIKHLPVFWDELRLTDEIAQEFLQMMFQLSQGRERTRLTANVDFRETGTWETILVCASNNHLASLAYDPAMRTNANLKRLFEYDIPYDGETPMSVDGTEVFNNLRFNYGHAGIEYVKFLVANFSTVRSEVLAMNKAIYKKVGAKNEDRFWIGTMTCLLMGAKYAKQCGLIDFDLAGIKEFLFTTYSKMQTVETDVVETDTSVRYLVDYLRETEGASIVYKGRRPRQGRFNEPVTIERVPSDSRQGLSWEYYAEDGFLRLSKSPFLDYMRRRRLRKREVFEELEKLGFQCFVDGRAVLGAGTRFAGITRAYVIDMLIPESERAAITTTQDSDA